MRSEPSTSVRSVDGGLLATIVESAFAALSISNSTSAPVFDRGTRPAHRRYVARASIKLARYEM
jgi:hypothetical protein